MPSAHHYIQVNEIQLTVTPENNLGAGGDVLYSDEPSPFVQSGYGRHAQHGHIEGSCGEELSAIIRTPVLNRVQLITSRSPELSVCPRQRISSNFLLFFPFLHPSISAISFTLACSFWRLHRNAKVAVARKNFLAFSKQGIIMIARLQCWSRNN